MTITGRTPGRLQRLADAVLARALGQPGARNPYTVELGVRVPMRDGVELVADHYAPRTSTPHGTVLIRTPYGRGFPDAALNGRGLAARGYHVLIQSVRGTFGSGGDFRPMAQEADDGQDTVAWLRTRPWFTGDLATLGGSYLGWVQWALLQDPPPELRTSIVYVGPHDFREAVFGTGSFTLGDFLGWADQIAYQEDTGPWRRLTGRTAARRRLAPALAGLPLAEAAAPALDGRTPWYFEWLANAENEAFWPPYRAGAALDRVDVPVLLITGWQDLFLDQSLKQYRILHDRGVDVALTVGPWDHFGVFIKGAGLNSRDTLSWLDEHLAGTGSRTHPPVKAFRTGSDRWLALPTWPPAHTSLTLHPIPDGILTTTTTTPAAATTTATAPATATATAPATATATATFRFDPADPTPSVGGRVMTGDMGVRDNRRREARPDVVTFTTSPLEEDLDVAGAPVIELALAVDNPHADVFVRLCDVDVKGRSLNFSDRFHRLDPEVPAGRVQHLRLELDHCFHRLRAGHRLRLQLSGGAFPRYARNLGTGGNMADGANLAPATHTVHLGETHLTLPLPVRRDDASTIP